MSLDWIGRAMDELRRRGLMRETRALDTPQGAVIELCGREVINFSSNDYLGLAGDRRLRRAASAAAWRWGAGSGSSRLIAGNLAIVEKLEGALAEFMGTESALVFTSGYHANIGVIPALVGAGDMVLSDRMNHASIIDGCRLSGVDTLIYEHCDPESLKEKLSEASGAGRKLVVFESVFSMDGDLAPLPELIEVARTHGAMVMVDEAHALGVLGERGRGGLEHFGLQSSDVDVVMGTLGKSLGSSGAFVCGEKRLCDYLVNRARSFVFTTGPAPAAVGAALEALRIVRDEPWRRERALAHAERLRAALSAPGAAAIIPVIIGDPDRTMRACESLLERGLFVQGIRPPTVPEGTSRLRVNVSAAHEDKQVDELIEGLKEALE